MEKIVTRPTNAELGRESRNRRVPVMLTDSEYAEIETAAAREGLAVSVYLRTKALKDARNAE